MIIPAQHGEAVWVFDMTGDPDPYLVTLGGFAATFNDWKNFVDAMASGWNTNIKSAMTTEITLREVRSVYNDGAFELTYVKSSNTAGTGGTSVLPSNCAVLVQKVTGLAGRKFQGRNFWPSCVAEGSVDARGLIAGGTVTALQTAFTALYTAIDGVANSNVSLLHSDATAPSAVLGFTVKPVIATQRRRMR